MDANPKDVRQALKNDDITFPNVCDGKMLSTPLLKTFGLTQYPIISLFVMARLLSGASLLILFVSVIA